MAKKPVRPRTLRRHDERAAKDAVKARARLAELEPGGSAAHPISVSTASLVEPEARGMPCALCGGEVRVVEHAAHEGLRPVHVVCTRCGAPRTVYFRVVPLAN